jgi:hypothetical protein
VKASNADSMMGMMTRFLCEFCASTYNLTTRFSPSGFSLFISFSFSFSYSFFYFMLLLFISSCLRFFFFLKCWRRLQLHMRFV